MNIPSYADELKFLQKTDVYAQIMGALYLWILQH